MCNYSDWVEQQGKKSLLEEQIKKKLDKNMSVKEISKNVSHWICDWHFCLGQVKI